VNPTNNEPKSTTDHPTFYEVNEDVRSFKNKKNANKMGVNEKNELTIPS
jgi:hypothetical protein